jgi:hypothetical protein
VVVTEDNQRVDIVPPQNASIQIKDEDVTSDLYTSSGTVNTVNSGGYVGYRGVSVLIELNFHFPSSIFV